MPRSGVAEKLTILHCTVFAGKQLTFDPVPPVLGLLEVDELGLGVELETILREVFTITEKAFTFKTLC